MPNQEISPIEAEIAELSRKIAEKRTQLETDKGIIPEARDMVAEVVRTSIEGGVTSVAPTAVPADDQSQQATSTQPVTSTKTYLSDLSGDDIAKVNSLIELVHKKGVKKTIEEAKGESPFIMDAFHDALIDLLHDELKERGVI